VFPLILQALPFPFSLEVKPATSLALTLHEKRHDGSVGKLGIDGMLILIGFMWSSSVSGGTGQDLMSVRQNFPKGIKLKGCFPLKVVSGTFPQKTTLK
jgi:hypothetical protein